MEKSLTLIEGPKLCLCKFATKERPPKDKRPQNISCAISTTIGFDEDCDKLNLSVLAKSESTAIPFNFEVIMEATFQINNKQDHDQLAKIAVLEGAPVIFAVLRELIADLTRKSHYPPFYLPQVDFSTKEPKKVKEKLALPKKPMSRLKKVSK